MDSTNRLMTLLRNLSDQPRRDHHNELRVAGWAVLWIGAWWVTDAGQQNGLVSGLLPNLLAIGLVCGLGLGTMAAFSHFVRNADELRRKIELDGIVAAAGLGFFTAFALPLIEQGAVIQSVSIYMVPVAMLAGYVVAVLNGYWRHS
ncbi:MAG: hypothetical protein ACI9W4_002557 [Rhodothermales bacterium]|jgi:hypothetical protein